MDLIKNWKLHLLALLIVIVAESIGMKRFDLIIFLPLFYALIIGGIISYPNFKLLKLPEMERASRVLSVGMLILVTKLGLDIGPNLEQLANSSLALLVQEFGHFFGTLVFGLPVAFLVGMKREAIGACYSIDREPNIAIIAERYGLDSPEGRGVMGMYMRHRFWCTLGLFPCGRHCSDGHLPSARSCYGRRHRQCLHDGCFDCLNYCFSSRMG